jgi:hypothetical protein
MLPRSVLPLVLALVVGASSSCTRIDLARSLSVVEVFGGYYDVGIVNGLNKLVPSVTFKLRNTGTVPITGVQLLVSFWQDGADGELDSREVRGIGSDAVEPGATTDPILVRSATGYTLEQPRAELFTHRMFKDVVVKIFAKRAGEIVPIGEFRIERRILPHSIASGV